MPDASDHRSLPPLIGADEIDEDEETASLVETAEDLEQLEEDTPGGVAPV